MPSRVSSGCAPRYSLPDRPQFGGPQSERRRSDPSPSDPLLSDPGFPSIVARLRRAGCVFAEDEAAILLTASDAAGLESLIARRVAGEPLEQIVGWVDFAGLHLQVRPGMFVPRQRTRQLAEATLDALADMARNRGPNGAKPKMLEAFCGAGPVASVVAASSGGAAARGAATGTVEVGDTSAGNIADVEIHVGDAHTEAVECAVANVAESAQTQTQTQTQALAPDVSVHGHTLDCLHGLPEELRQGIAVIAAVPPYVPSTAAEFLPREAVDFEPADALFGGPDGMDLVRRLITEATDWLAPDGVLLIELSREQAAAATEFANQQSMAAHSRLGEDELTLTLELRPSA